MRREIGGVERWARELAERLPRLRPERYTVIRPPAALAHRAGQAWEQLVLPLAARGSELLISPANLAPLAAPGNIVVIHDAAPFHDPAWQGRAYRSWHRLLVPRIARRARLVIVPSEYVRAELVELFGLDTDRVRAIAPGVDGRFADPGDPKPLLRRLGLERPYVLAVGTDSPRKNLALLDRISPALEAAGLEVAIAGAARSYLPRSEPGAARRLGYVPDADLPALYAGAAAFAMPSLYEGFGLPCIEAMATGTPVVTSDRAALPEACGGAALLADPGDPEAFAAALTEAAGSARSRLTEAGLTRAAGLSWERSAERVDAAIDELLGASSGRGPLRSDGVHAPPTGRRP
jgi:glycosyltransferase involved in cell wall biosynthesis